MQHSDSTTEAPDMSHPTVEQLEAWLTERVAFHLERSVEEIDPATPLADFGIDSVAAISICGEIEQHFLLPVPATIVFDYPTVQAISAHIAERLSEEQASGARGTGGAV